MKIRCVELRKNKSVRRLRRAARKRALIRRQASPRLTVHRTLQHIYAQVTSPDGGRIFCTASTVSKELKGKLSVGGNIEAAKQVGALIAARCLNAGIKKIVFDTSGFKYHGRVKALAEAARTGGLEF
jgi:large subunit ribosomal protein L18